MATYQVTELWTLLTTKILTGPALPIIISTSLLLYILSPLADSKLRKIPGPWLASISELPRLVMSIRGSALPELDNLCKKYGKVVRSAPDVLLVSGKDDVWKILVEEDFVKDPEYEMLGMERGYGSIFNETDKGAHRLARRLLSSGFSISYLNGLEGVMQECLKECVGYLDEQCQKADGGAVIDISLLMGNLCFDIQASTSLGGSMHLVKNNDTIVKATFMSTLFRMILAAKFPFLAWWPGFMQKAELTAMLNGILEKRRQDIKNKNVKKDVLQVLLDAHEAEPQRFTEKHVKENMLVFMIAGSDTTGVTSMFALFLLLKNPEKLKALRKEIDEIFPSKDAVDDITFARTQELTYLNAVINETMRLMPVASAGLERVATKPMTLSGYDIPAGTRIQTVPSALQHDPEIWPDADSFVPERWLGEYKGAVVDKKAFLPFSAGSRNCIGQQYALKELRIILATIVRRYDFSEVKGQDETLRHHVVPYFYQGFYNMKFKMRK